VGLSGIATTSYPRRAASALVASQSSSMTWATRPSHFTSSHLTYENWRSSCRGVADGDVITAAARFRIFDRGRSAVTADGGVITTQPISHAVALGAQGILRSPKREARRAPSRNIPGALGASDRGTELSRRRAESICALLEKTPGWSSSCPETDWTIQPINFSHSQRP